MHIKKETLIILLIFSISLFLGARADNTATPGDPTLNIPSTGNFWVNYTWSAGVNTDSFNVSVNGTSTNGTRNWTNGTTITYSNTSVGPHGKVYIWVAGYNTTSKQLSGFVYGSKQVEDNPIILTNVLPTYDLYEGDTLYIAANYTDADNDRGTFDSTITRGTFNKSTGVLLWKTGARDNGTYNWQINVSDGYGYTSSPQPFTVTVYPNIPDKPTNLASATVIGNFWVNYTWLAGAKTDSFNVSINGNWTNGTKNNSINTKSSPHGWVNISVAGYNATSQLLSGFVSMTTQVPNNPIILTNVSDSYLLNEGDTLYIAANHTDADGDRGTFDTTATKGTFNKSTGVLFWKTGTGDGGIYNWQINVTDGYGPGPSKQLKVIVPLRLSIKFVEPAITNDREQWVNARVGHIGKFIGAEVTFNNTGEDSLYLSITEIYNNTRYKLPLPKIIAKDGFLSSRTEFEINSSGVKGGLFNYTYEIEANGFNGEDFTFSYRNTTTISLPIIPIYKMKQANGGKAAVIAGGTTTITYTLEANSSVNLTNTSIYDTFYPENGGYFIPNRGKTNEGKLEANNSQNVTYTYAATSKDLSSNKFKCDEGYPCIINLATFTGFDPINNTFYNDTDYVEIPLGAIPSKSNPPSSGGSGNSPGGGGGGGGGGMPPSEDFNNIERREVREMDVSSRQATVYAFKAAYPVMAVSFESSISENEVPVAVEVLRNRSKKVGVDAPGKLYKYFNVFVGMSGFSKKVSNGVVAFRVNNSWLEKNGLDPKDISLYKWEGSWVEKNTEIAERNQNQTYYASLVGNFSSFAISGVKKQEADLLILDDSAKNTTLASGSSNSSNVKPVSEALKLSGALILIFGITGIIYYLKRNHKIMKWREKGK